MDAQPRPQPPSEPRPEPAADSADDQARRDRNDAWDAFSLVAAGIAFWGGVGWLVSQWLDNRIFVMFGLLLGMAGALYLVWVRYGKP